MESDGANVTTLKFCNDILGAYYVTAALFCRWPLVDRSTDRRANEVLGHAAVILNLR